MNEPIKLKPCPFCGSESVEAEKSGSKNDRSTGYIECTFCYCRGPFDYSDQAEKAWNTRTCVCPPEPDYGDYEY